MIIPEFLSRYSATMPECLKNFSEDTPVFFSKIMGGRIGYYPGWGDDGQLIELCSMSHTAHTFLYFGYFTRRNDVIKTLKKPGALLGYYLIGKVEFRENDLLPCGKYPSVTTRDPFFDKLRFQPHFSI